MEKFKNMLCYCILINATGISSCVKICESKLAFILLSSSQMKSSHDVQTVYTMYMRLTWALRSSHPGAECRRASEFPEQI